MLPTLLIDGTESFYGSLYVSPNTTVIVKCADGIASRPTLNCTGIKKKVTRSCKPTNAVSINGTWKRIVKWDLRVASPIQVFCGDANEARRSEPQTIWIGGPTLTLSARPQKPKEALEMNETNEFLAGDSLLFVARWPQHSDM